MHAEHGAGIAVAGGAGDERQEAFRHHGGEKQRGGVADIGVPAGERAAGGPVGRAVAGDDVVLDEADVVARHGVGTGKGVEGLRRLGADLARLEEGDRLREVAPRMGAQEGAAEPRAERFREEEQGGDAVGVEKGVMLLRRRGVAVDLRHDRGVARQHRGGQAGERRQQGDVGRLVRRHGEIVAGRARPKLPRRHRRLPGLAGGRVRQRPVRAAERPLDARVLGIEQRAVGRVGVRRRHGVGDGGGLRRGDLRPGDLRRGDLRRADLRLGGLRRRGRRLRGGCRQREAEGAARQGATPLFHGFHVLPPYRRHGSEDDAARRHGGRPLVAGGNVPI